MKEIIKLTYWGNLNLEHEEFIAVANAIESLSKKKQIFWPASYIEEEVNFFECTWKEGPTYDHDGYIVKANASKGYEKKSISESEYNQLLQWVEKEKDEHILFIPRKYTSFPKKEIVIKKVFLATASTKKEWEKLVKSHFGWRFQERDLINHPWKK